MQVTIQEKKENKLLNRREVSGTISYENATPSNKEITQAIAKQLNIEANLVVMKHIYNKFSHQQATFSAVVYDKVEVKTKTERINSHLRKKLEEEAKKATA